jgi:ribosomal protein L37AE/L43A
MVFHILPLLAVGATKWIIKEVVDAPCCEKCGTEKIKMWIGMRLIFACEKCDDIKALKAIKVVSTVIKVATLGVSYAANYRKHDADLNLGYVIIAESDVRQWIFRNDIRGLIFFELLQAGSAGDISNNAQEFI